MLRKQNLTLKLHNSNHNNFHLKWFQKISSNFYNRASKAWVEDFWKNEIPFSTVVYSKPCAHDDRPHKYAMAHAMSHRVEGPSGTGVWFAESWVVTESSNETTAHERRESQKIRHKGAPLTQSRGIHVLPRRGSHTTSPRVLLQEGTSE